MKRRFLTIFSIFVAAIVLIAMVPGCDGEPTTGTIVVDATLNSLPWSGAVEYTLTGPGALAPTIINGSSVSANHTGEAGNWTCAYVSGGPPGAVFVDITPSPAQTLAAGGTIGFTLNFETPPPPDASVEFSTWTINGQPVDPAQGPFPMFPGDWVDVEYKEHVSGGQEGQVVTVHQTSWLLVHYQGPFGGGLLVGFDPIWLHVVNAPGAVSMDPPAEGKSNQQATVEGQPVSYCDEIELPYCEPVALDVEVDWELKICTNYTKTINWIGFGGAGPMTLVLNGAEVLFDISGLQPVPDPCFSLTSMACVNVEGDINPANNCTDWCTPLDICYQALLP
jgi:hypothetical protein